MNKKPADRYPSETFVLACQAASQIEPISSTDDDETQRFYRELCSALDIPDPMTLTSLALEKAPRILDNTPNVDDAWLASAVRVHAGALHQRMERIERYPVCLLGTNGILDVIRSSTPT